MSSQTWSDTMQTCICPIYGKPFSIYFTNIFHMCFAMLKIGYLSCYNSSVLVLVTDSLWRSFKDRKLFIWAKCLKYKLHLHDSRNEEGIFQEVVRQVEKNVTMKWTTFIQRYCAKLDKTRTSTQTTQVNRNPRYAQNPIICGWYLGFCQEGWLF